MRKLSKILALVLVLMTFFAFTSMFSASAASQPEYLYLTPNANWKVDNARFAAYFFGNGETWVSMTWNASVGAYEVKVPTNKTYPNVIFCRMNPSASANNWNNKWNQTADLTIPTNGTNHYTVKEGTWDKGGGTWTTANSSCSHVGGAAATCTTAQLCTKCGEEVASALGHTYDSSHKCSRCNGQATFTVAGSGAHLGTEWDTTNTANDMTYADGVYTKVYTNVAAGSYLLKVARDHDWGTAYPSSDKAYSVATSGSTVTVTLKGTTVTITVEAPHVHSWSDATCTEAPKCSCGETQGEALGHTWADATCTVAKTCSVCGATEGEALGHSHSAVVTDPTCTEAGYTTYTCACGDTYTGDEVAALGHDMVAGEVVAPTYTADGYTVYSCSVCGVTENRDVVAALVLAGAGTEEDPYVIDSLEALVAFRDSVNAGETKYNAKGVYVALGANIDMASVDWSVNIGDDCNATFDGIFDGKGYTLYNLNATETSKKSDGYVCGGLFGAIYGDAVVKNLTIENVSINTGDFTGNNVAAVVGFVYAGKGTIENVTVCGNIEINANGIYGVGAIVGYAYSSNITVKDCKVVGADGSYINAKSGVGAIVGYANGVHVVDAEVSGLALAGNGLVGGILGITSGSASVNGANVSNVTLTAKDELWVNATGVAIGTISTNGIEVSGVVYENVTGADTLVGSAYIEKPTSVVPAVEARIGDKYYATLVAAVKAAANGETVVVLEDVVLAETIVVDGKTVTIDLNGKTIDAAFEAEKVEVLLVKNGANVTITGNGTMLATGEGTHVEVISAIDGAVVTIENGTFVSDGCTVIYATRGATVTINGGLYEAKVLYNGMDFTLDINEAEDVLGAIVVNGGSFVRFNPAKHNNDGVANSNKLANGLHAIAVEGVYVVGAHSHNATVTAPTCTEAGYTTYTCACGDTYTGDDVAAAGHTWVDATLEAPKTCSVCGETEGEALVAIAQIGDVGYLTFADALAAAKTMTGDVVVKIYGKVTLNTSLSGSFDSITFVGKSADAEIYLDVQGYITATGKTVSFEDLTLSKSSGGYIGNAGFMNVAFGIFDVTTVNYTNCTFSNGAYASSGTVTFDGCTFYRSHDKYGLWAYGDVDIVVQNSTFADYRGVKMYAEGAAKTVNLTVKNTDFSAVNNKPAIVLTYGQSVTLEGNTYSDTGVFELDLDGAPNGTTVTSTDAITCKSDNGACGVMVDGKIYITVADAAAVATSGSTVTLLHDSTETVELADGVTLDKNGYTADGVTVAHVHSYTEVVTAPTCTEAGYTTYTCACGDTYTDDEVAALGHIDEDSRDHECDVCGLLVSECADNNKNHKCDICNDVMSVCADDNKDHNCDWCGAQNSHCMDVMPYDHNCDWCGANVSEHNYETVVTAPTCTEAGYTTYTCACGDTYTDDEVAALGHTAGAEATCTTAQTCTVCGTELVAALGHNYEATVTAPTCTEAGYTTYTCACGDTYTDDEVAALGHVWNNCECTTCHAVLPTLSATDAFNFSTQANFDAVVAGGKLGFVGSFRDNGGSFQFNTNSTIQFVAPANSTVTIVGHSAQYGVFNVYLNGEKTVMEGSLTFTVTEETKVVIATGDKGASYSYIKSITLEEYIDRTISSDITINFGSEGNYKDSIVDFSGIQIGDNGGNNSQVKNGSFNLELKAGAVVTIHGYPKYTSYKLNGGDEITAEWHTYIALEDTVLTVTPVNGNNYFYSIEVKFHEGIELVEAKNPTCTEAGHGAYYACSCHNEPLTDKGVVAALGHTAGAEATCTTAQTCTVCGTELVAALGHTAGAEATCTTAQTCTVCGTELVAALGHSYSEGTCTVCGAVDPDYVAPEPTNDKLINFSKWEEFAKGTYADGDVYKYNDIFTFIMGKNSRVDGSSKTWDDFSGTLRFSFGGKTNSGVPTKNALKITVDGAYTLKIWYVAGGEARYFALLDAEGNVLSETTKETAQNVQYYSELTIPAAGVYYLTIPADNNYIFQIELVETTVAPHVHNYSAAVTAPTCTSIGYTTYTCECGDTYTGDEVAALEHEYVDGSCTVCGKEDPNYVAPHEHNYEATVTAPTCTGAGYTTYTCACGDTYTDDEVEALGHTYFYNVCLVCGEANPYFENNFTTVGDNKLVCNEYHLVDTDSHKCPYQFTLVTIPEDGLYIFTADATKLGVFIYTTEITTEGADFSVGGASWAAVTFGQAELKAGTYYLGFIFYQGVGEYDLTITKHTEHSFAEGVCTVCGTPDPEWVAPHEHEFVEGKCECGEVDPNYVAPQPPVEDEAEEDKTPLAKVWDIVAKVIAYIIDFFKSMFAKL